MELKVVRIPSWVEIITIHIRDLSNLILVILDYTIISVSVITKKSKTKKFSNVTMLKRLI